MDFLSASDILAADDIKIVAVEVPQWGGTVFVKTLNGPQREKWEAECRTDGESNKNNTIRPITVAMATCDKDGNLLFTPDQVWELAKKSGVALDILFEKIQEVNGLRDSDIEELEKNLKTAPDDDSISD